jgi:hypothetical protein
MKIDNEVIAKSDVDEDGGYDLMVDLNQIGIAEDEDPPVAVHADGLDFDLCGQVVESDDTAIYWTYWNEGNPAVNLQLHFA